MQVGWKCRVSLVSIKVEGRPHRQARGYLRWFCHRISREEHHRSGCDTPHRSSVHIPMGPCP